MNPKKTCLNGAVLTAWCVGSCLLVAPAWAEISRTAKLNAVVGLHSMMELSCTPLNLGVWRVPPRDAATPSLVMLDVDKPQEGVKLYQNTDIALASGRDNWSPAHGVCTLTQSRAMDMTSAKVSISNNRKLRVKGDATFYPGVNAPLTPAAGILVNVYAPMLTRIMNGQSTFLVGGSVSFPGRIVSGNHGAYTLLSGPIIRVDDGMRE
ncbi:MAG: hypothetical protein Q7U05_00830 [Polaromonas sp.]|nr:hypothetical protein [Polaromonas sp.]